MVEMMQGLNGWGLYPRCQRAVCPRVAVGGPALKASPSTERCVLYGWASGDPRCLTRAHPKAADPGQSGP